VHHSRTSRLHYRARHSVGLAGETETRRGRARAPTGLLRSAVPALMRAQVLRESRFGPPGRAFRMEELPVPAIGEDEVLLRVMAAGINANGVYAALGRPLNVIDGHRRAGLGVDFHIAGSDASGVAVAVGSGVRGVRPGDPLLVHGGVWDRHCPVVRAGHDPAFSPSLRAWGYQTPYGSFADYAVVQEHQCLRKPARLSWDEAAAFMVCAATAWRMLHAWEPHVVRPGDLVLVWGGAGGLGCQAVQIARAAGGRVLAVVSSDERAEYCRRLGALGTIDRREFDHWGPMPECTDRNGQVHWLEQARAFRARVRELSGGDDPRIVFEHPGRDTLPTSMHVCAPGGMVVTCGATSGYTASLDLRHTWMFSKRLQGSHGMNDTDAAAVLRLVEEGRLDPCVSHVVPFEEVGAAHQLLHENRQPPGNMVALVGAERPGLGREA
jgi:crotonyl-CoA carboxylase/reductase